MPSLFQALYWAWGIQPEQNRYTSYPHGTYCPMGMTSKQANNNKALLLTVKEEMQNNI